MKTLLILIIITLAATVSFAQSDVKRDIWQLTNDIKERIIYSDLEYSQLVSVRDGLKEILLSISGSNTDNRFMCIKSSNGRLYPAKSVDGSIIGSQDYNAGYSALDECKSSLPTSRTGVGCAKLSNGRSYPFNYNTGAAIGSLDYNAGYSSGNECKESLPKPGSRLACFKQANGRFYPTKVDTGSIVGSSDYNAGYSDLTSCMRSISQ